MVDSLDFLVAYPVLTSAKGLNGLPLLSNPLLLSAPAQVLEGSLIGFGNPHASCLFARAHVCVMRV